MLEIQKEGMKRERKTKDEHLRDLARRSYNTVLMNYYSQKQSLSRRKCSAV